MIKAVEKLYKNGLMYVKGVFKEDILLITAATLYVIKNIQIILEKNFY